MREKIVYLLLTGTLMLTACAGKGVEASSEAAEPSEAGSTETSSEGGEVQLVNPWRDVAEEEVSGVRIFTIPEGATNVAWSMMDGKGDEAALIQAKFELDGHEFTARTKYGAPEDEDISGMNYEWTSTDEGKLATWGGGNMDAKYYRYKGDECAELCTWYDIEIGISYSLSTAADNLDGVDIKAVAEAMAPKEEETVMDSFVEEAAGKTEFESYEEIISYLKKDQGYAKLKLKGYDGEVLAVTDYIYTDKQANCSIRASIYGKVGDVVKCLGNVDTNGTAYPLAIGEGALYACHSHLYQVYYVTPDGDGLMLKDCIEEYAEQDTPTYIGFTRESNNFDDTVDFTGGEKEYEEYWKNYYAATPINFTVVE